MILVNEKFFEREEVKIDLEDRGYQFGDGVYEVVRVYNGKTFRMDDHITRLKRSVNEIRIKLPMEPAEIKEKIHQLVEKNSLKDGIIYFQVTRGASPRNHSFPENTTSVLTAYTRDFARPLNDIKNGIKTVTIDDIRWLRCDIKTINLLGNVLAKQFAVENNAKEAVQIRGDYVTEGSSSNFYIVKDGTIITHPANNLILKGITRIVIEEIAAKLDIPFVEKEFTLDEALNADEAFISSTTAEVSPVIQINDHILSEQPGPVVRKLQAEFEQLI